MIWLFGVSYKNMKHYQSAQGYIIVCEKGESLTDQLLQFVQDTGIKTAWIEGLGAALELEIGYFDLVVQEYRWKKFADGPYEIGSMQGNIVVDDAQKVLLHIHGVFADRECQAFAGHINSLIVGGTCEILVRTLDMPLTRKKDEVTGLDVLCSVPPLQRA